MVSAVLLGFPVLSPDVAFHFSEIAYVIIPIAAGAALVAAALTLRGRQRTAWVTIGAGVVLWGVGELIWVFYEYALSTEVPYPGWADVAYVAGYPVILAGILLLPHVKPLRLERVRITVDAMAGTVAVAAIMWVAYLSDQVYIDPEVGFFEQFVNLMYPMGDVILLIAVMILATRRSEQRFDVRLLALAAGLIITVLADVLYVVQVEAGSYVSGGKLDSLWLFAYGAFALAAWYLLHPAANLEQPDRSTRYWQLIAPYGAIVVLFALTLWHVGGEGSVLEVATALVALLVIIRQGVAIRENRELVEQQRNDLIASISHELRTPMTSVTGFTEVLHEEWEILDAEQRAEMLSIVNHQARHVNRIVTDLVGLARDNLKFSDLEVEPCDLANIIVDAETMLGDRLHATVAADTHLEPGLWVEADSHRLTQVVVNLLTNAVRYGNGEVRVDAYRRNGDASLEIHDDGPGVPKRFEETIWERFERGAHRYDASIPGSGVGLPIARAIVHAHGGSITQHRSDRLGGACFVVSLPASVETTTARTSAAAARTGTPG
jgi:signal transduction histidine kinase